MGEIYDYDIAAGNNNDAPPDGFPENMEYAQVNNAARELMAGLARWRAAGFSAATTAGTQPAYTLSSGQNLLAYADGQHFSFLAHATSTGLVTLNVDSVGAVAVRDSRGNQLTTGDIQLGGIYRVVKVSASWRVVGHLSAASLALAASNTLSQAFTTGGSSNAFTITSGSFPAAYANGQLIAFVADRANTGAATLNINGLGAEALEDIDSNALAANDIVTNQVMLACRVAGEWRIFAGLPISLANHVVGTLGIANGGSGQVTAAAAFTAFKQPATDSATGVVEYATTAEVHASPASSDQVMRVRSLNEAANPVGLTDAATIAWNWTDGINFTCTIAGNRIIGNPNFEIPGQWRTILLTGNDATLRTITFGTEFFGDLPVITNINNNNRYLLMIYCWTAGGFAVSAKKVS